MPIATSGALHVYRTTSFRRGLDVKTSPFVLAQRRVNDSLTMATNVVYSTSGGLSKRLDVAAYNTTSLGGTVAITGGHLFRHSNGTDYNVCGTDDGRLVRLNTDGTTTNLVTGLATGRRWSFAVYNDLLIACNGSDAPRKYNGTTVAALLGSPPSTASVVIVHQNRVLMLDQTQLSRLTFSALNSEEDYTTANNAGTIQVYPNDSQNLIGMISAINEVILVKPNFIYRLQGASPATGYAITNVVPAPQIAGGISFMGLVAALNDVWLLATDGIHSLYTVQAFGDLKQSFASEPISPYFTPNTDFTVSLNRLNLGAAVYDRQNARLYFSVDSDNNEQNDTIFVYDLFTKGWSRWRGIAAASLWIVRNSTNGREEVFAGGYDGFARVLNRSAATNTIDGEARHISNLGVSGIEKSPRHLYMHVAEQGNYNLSVNTSFDFGATGGQTSTVSLLGGSRTLGVNWTLGTDALGARDQIIKRLDMAGVGEYLEVRARNGNAGEPFTWFGYECYWRARRLVRRGA